VFDTCVLLVLEDFTEELLSQHDAELQRLKQHHEDHQQLFDGIHQWEDSWRLYLELEVRATPFTKPRPQTQAGQSAPCYPERLEGEGS